MAWLQVWGPSIVAVFVATTLSTGINVIIEHVRRRGVRALLSAEIMHNQEALVQFVGQLSAILGTDYSNAAGGDPRIVAATFRAASKPPVWERTRWNLPDVGVTLRPLQLTILSEWYAKLNQVSLQYGDVRGNIAALNITSFRGIPLQAAEMYLNQMRLVRDFTTDVKDNPPSLPDRRFGVDATTQQFVKEVREKIAAMESQQAE